MKYLVDTSALVRILRRQASPDWDDLDFDVSEEAMAAIDF